MSTVTSGSLELGPGTTLPNSKVTSDAWRRSNVRRVAQHSKEQAPKGLLATLAVSRLQAVITSFLLRRMKNSMLDGKRLIELPDKTVSLVKLEFSEEEREIYRMVTLNIPCSCQMC
jgi:SNF2 family DNA or RNA helicase